MVERYLFFGSDSTSVFNPGKYMIQNKRRSATKSAIQPVISLGIKLVISFYSEQVLQHTSMILRSIWDEGDHGGDSS